MACPNVSPQRSKLQHPTLMKDHATRILGGVLIVSGLIILFGAPEELGIAKLFLFLFCFVPGVLLLQGLIGRDPLAAKIRREALTAARAPDAALPEVPEQVFRYCTNPLRRTLVTLLCLGLGTGLLAAGCWVVRVMPGGLGMRILTAWPMLAFGPFLWWYVFRFRSLYIKVDTRGVEARLYFRTVMIPWTEIVALIAREYHTVFIAGAMPVPLSAGTVYSVYSQRARLSFSGGLESYGELAGLLSRVTRLEWRRP